MSGEPNPEAFHIVSLVVQANPRQLTGTCRKMASIDGVEVHIVDPIGKLVVTVEAEHHAAVTRSMEAIRQLSGVLTVSLVFHQEETGQSTEQGVQV